MSSIFHLYVATFQ